MTKIAVIGLGAMGARMARRLLGAGHELTVYNRTPARAEALVAAGARLAATPKDAADGAEVVLTMLTDDDVARWVWLDPEAGIVNSIPSGATAVECSTVTPAWIRSLHDALSARGVTLVDAPVAGSRPQAEAGQLIFLVGGPPAALERIRPILSVMGGAIHHAGERGAGAWLKLAVNSLFGIQVAALSELLGMLDKAGISPPAAMAVLGEIPVTSPAAKGIGGLIAADRHAPLFPIDLVEKDFRYALLAGREVGAALPTVEAGREVYAKAQQAGHGDANISGVAKLYLD